jgi:hypothetical protein
LLTLPKVASSAVTAIAGQNEKREVWELIEMRKKIGRERDLIQTMRDRGAPANRARADKTTALIQQLVKPLKKFCTALNSAAPSARGLLRRRLGGDAER